MAGEQYKRIKCKVFRADDADDMSDIFVGEGGLGMQATIKVGESVDLPEPLYNILRMAEYPANRKVEHNGQMRVESYMKPRFSISVEGIEVKSDTDKRLSTLSLQQGKAIDVLSDENAKLKEQIAKLQAANLIPDATEK